MVGPWRSWSRARGRAAAASRRRSGAAGMGVVYRARQLELGRDVAVKVISPERVEDPAARRRFLREVRAAAAVEHPTSSRSTTRAARTGTAYVVMRYVRRRRPAHLVRVDGPLEPARAAEIVRRLGDALDAIHARATCTAT